MITIPGLFVRFELMGAPSNVEYKRLNTPATLTAWQEAAATAVSSKGSFIECETKEDVASHKTQKLLINVARVLDVIQE